MPATRRPEDELRLTHPSLSTNLSTTLSWKYVIALIDGSGAKRHSQPHEPHKCAATRPKSDRICAILGGGLDALLRRGIVGEQKNFT